MKSMFTGTGGAVVGFWKALPVPAKVLVVAGLLVLGVAELTVEYNQAVNSPDLARGQAGVALAEAEAKQAEATAANATIEDIRNRRANGQNVSAAEAIKLKDYEVKEQEARKLEAEATLKEYEVFVNKTILEIVGDALKVVRDK
jgi:hypothetical protein